MGPRMPSRPFWGSRTSKSVWGRPWDGFGAKLVQILSAGETGRRNPGFQDSSFAAAARPTRLPNRFKSHHSALRALRGLHGARGSASPPGPRRPHTRSPPPAAGVGKLGGGSGWRVDPAPSPRVGTTTTFDPENRFSQELEGWSSSWWCMVGTAPFPVFARISPRGWGSPGLWASRGRLLPGRPPAARRNPSKHRERGSSDHTPP